MEKPHLLSAKTHSPHKIVGGQLCLRFMFEFLSYLGESLSYMCVFSTGCALSCFIC